MKYIRLPSRPGDEPQYWQWGKHSQQVILLPGDVLLSEMLTLPVEIKTSGQMKQWLLANTHLCQWSPEKEKLLYIDKIGDQGYYWAVSHELWRDWHRIPGIAGSRWLPDWMLLPEPDIQTQQVFALKADDTIIFRHGARNGGALPLALAYLFEPLKTRWLMPPGRATGCSVSTSYLHNQVSRYGSRWMSLPSLSGFNVLLPVLLAISAGFAVPQTAEYIWLNATREPAGSRALPETSIQPENNPLAYSANLLDQIQQLGPIILNEMSLDSGMVQLHTESPVACDILQERLKDLPLTISEQQQNAVCLLDIKGPIR